MCIAMLNLSIGDMAWKEGCKVETLFTGLEHFIFSLLPVLLSFSYEQPVHITNSKHFLTPIIGYPLVVHPQTIP